jgi:GNAT superfamily N-acetyltransferase
MFKIEPMQPQNYAFATELANSMNWNMAPEDFEFNVALEPHGCFVLFDDIKPVGIATCISYGRIGWFGNLIVKEEIRQRGGGSLLVKHAITYLQSKGAETIGLYAYPNLLSFYGELGFKKDEELIILKAAPVYKSCQRDLPKINECNFRSVALLDEQCFGGDRNKLLRSIFPVKGNLAFYLSGVDGVVGYVASTVFETIAWVGPLMCIESREDMAVKLLEAALTRLQGKDAFVATPKKNKKLICALQAKGFVEDFSVVRMYFGKVAARNCIYLAESLERG